MGDSLNQSRSHYQSGYLMSVAQNDNQSQNNQRYDDAPIVPTKAKMHSILSGAAASDFGMSSMFESTRERQRQTFTDEDAPPTNSVNDIVNEVYTDSAASRRQQLAMIDSPARASLFRPSQSQAPATPKMTPSTSTKPVHVIVFGYPADKYTATVEYFRSLGDSTEPEQNPEIMNCFRIGYLNAADALRAARKNGDILGGCWMVGVKWADPAQAEALLGPALVRGSLPYSSPEGNNSSQDVPMSTSPSRNRGFSADTSLVVARSTAGTPTVGTPIKLAPSTSAFRKPGSGTKPAPKPASSAMVGALPGTPGINQSPSKGVIGQVSDLIFGW